MAMFLFGKKERAEAEEQYKELLESIGKNDNNTEGFVLGEKKDIYDTKMSLDDIISKNN